MLKIITTLLMIFTLNGCQTKYEQKLICKQISLHQIPPTPLCDISFKYDRCRCRCFDYNSWDALSIKDCGRFQNKLNDVKTVNNVEVIDYELEYCDGIAGSFNNDQAVNVRPHVKALYRIKQNLCQ